MVYKEHFMFDKRGNSKPAKTSDIRKQTQKMNCLILVLAVGVLSATGKCWIFQQDLDCITTNWSEWSSPPDNCGKITRDRVILRWSSKNGEPCPRDLIEASYIQKDQDCSVTAWSAWSENFGFGQQSRRREVICPQLGSGIACPVLEEVRSTGQAPSVNVTAAQVTNFFIRPNMIVSRRKRQADAETDQVRDLILIMDSSGSIGSTRFSEANSQISRLLALLCPSKPFDREGRYSSQYNKGAMLTFSSTVTKTFDFDDCQTTSAVQNAIATATYIGGGTNTAEAFKQAKTLFETSSGARSENIAKREILILTDGRSNNRAQTLAAVEALRGTAEVYGLMTGSQSDTGMAELTQYVSPPINQHLFYIENIRDLKSLVDYVEDAKKKLGAKWCAPFIIN